MLGTGRTGPGAGSPVGSARDALLERERGDTRRWRVRTALRRAGHASDSRREPLEERIRPEPGEIGAV